MKKFLTLALALVFALSVAVPAMAFTGVAYEGDATVSDEFELAIKLIDVLPGYVTVNFLEPATDRGYLKNEMVCAVVGLWVAKDVKPNKYFEKLTFSGTNVSLWQDENFRGDRVGGRDNRPSPDGGGWGMLQYLSKNAYQKLFAKDAMPFQYDAKMAVNNSIVLANPYLNALYEKDSAQTYYFAIFARIIADGATVNAKLSGSNDLKNAELVKDVSNTVADDPIIGGLAAGMFGIDPTDAKQLKKLEAYINERAWGASNLAINNLGNFQADFYTLNWTKFNDDYDVAMYDATGSLPGNGLVQDDEIGYYVRYHGGASRANDNLFLIITNSKGICETLYGFDPSYSEDCLTERCAFAVTVRSGGSYLFSPTTGIDTSFYTFTGAVTSGSLYRELAGLVDDVIVGDFNLDPAYEDGLMKKSWWNDALGNSLFVEVAIEPWYAEITVPPEIVVDPPKTGDAMSILGFVMIALAGLAVVAIRKVRA